MTTERWILAIGGSAGSGKTSWRKMHWRHLDNVYVHDMDEELLQLPGYQKDVKEKGLVAAFENWRVIARDLADEKMHFAILAGRNIVYDRTCGAEESYRDLRLAKDHDYRIDLTGLCVDLDVAYQRVLHREKEVGRTVTKAQLEEYRARFSALWPLYLSFVDSAVLYDTSIPENVKLIYENGEIVDPDRYESFLEEGKSIFQRGYRSSYNV